MNVKEKQQKHVECRQRNKSTLSGKQEGGLDAGETLSTKCTNSAKTVHDASEKNKSLAGEVEKDLQQVTKQPHPTDFTPEFRGIGPYEPFLPIQRIA